MAKGIVSRMVSGAMEQDSNRRTRKRREQRQRARTRKREGQEHEAERVQNGGLPANLRGHRLAGAYMRFVERVDRGEK